MSSYRNNKTGKIYYAVSDAVDCTNSRDGTVVVIYHEESNPYRMYVREATEFAEKFSLISTD